MGTQRQDRLDAARAWRDSVGLSAPAAEDVELVVRLGVTDIDVANELILVDGVALRQHWASLLAALTPGPAVVPAEHVAEPATPPDATAADTSLTGVAGARVRAL